MQAAPVLPSAESVGATSADLGRRLRLQAGEFDGLAALAAEAEAVAGEALEGRLQVANILLESALLGEGRLLHLHGIEPGKTPDGDIRLDRCGAVAETGEFRPVFLQPLLHHGTEVLTVVVVHPPEESRAEE